MSRKKRYRSNPVEPGVTFGLGLLVGLGAGLGIYYLAASKQTVVVEAKSPISIPPMPRPTGPLPI